MNLKNHVLLRALMLFPLASFADTVDLGAHGTLSISVPKEWKLVSTKQATGVDLVISPSGDANAQLLFSIVYVPHGVTAFKADVDAKVLAEAQGFVSTSVEKKAVLRKYSMSGDAYGTYCLLTDASLVGKAPEKGNYKVFTVGIIWFNDEVGVSVSQVCDDEKGPEFSAMLGMVNSAVLANR